MWKFGMLATVFAVMGVAAHAGGNEIVTINGHSMMPLRTFSQRFGAVIDYDNGRQAISVAMGNRYVDLVPYSTTAWIEQTPCRLDAPVVIIDDTTYVPVQFMCQAFGLGYSWDNADQQVVIVTQYQAPVVFGLDFGWTSRAHVWRHDYDGRDYMRYGHAASHQYAQHQPSWQHGQQPYHAGYIRPTPWGNSGQYAPAFNRNQSWSRGQAQYRGGNVGQSQIQRGAYPPAFNRNQSWGHSQAQYRGGNVGQSHAQSRFGNQGSSHGWQHGRNG